MREIIRASVYKREREYREREGKNHWKKKGRQVDQDKWEHERIRAKENDSKKRGEKPARKMYCFQVL